MTVPTPKRPPTDKELADFSAYERVRARGLYNMLTRQAECTTGLSREAYTFVMTNYEWLATAAELRKGAKK